MVGGLLLRELNLLKNLALQAVFRSLVLVLLLLKGEEGKVLLFKMN